MRQPRHLSQSARRDTAQSSRNQTLSTRLRVAASAGQAKSPAQTRRAGWPHTSRNWRLHEAPRSTGSVAPGQAETRNGSTGSPP